MEKKYKRLVWSIVLDGIGLLSYWVPVIGEGIDIVWAPVAGWVFYKMYGGRVGVIGGVVTMLEEVFPYTDIIPTFTVGWLVKEFYLEKKKPKE